MNRYNIILNAIGITLRYIFTISFFQLIKNFLFISTLTIDGSIMGLSGQYILPAIIAAWLVALIATFVGLGKRMLHVSDVVVFVLLWFVIGIASGGFIFFELTSFGITLSISEIVGIATAIFITRHRVHTTNTQNQ